MLLGHCGDEHMWGQRPSCCNTMTVIPPSRTLAPPGADAAETYQAVHPSLAAKTRPTSGLACDSAPFTSDTLCSASGTGALSSSAHAPLVHGLLPQAPSPELEVSSLRC